MDSFLEVMKIITMTKRTGGMEETRRKNNEVWNIIFRRRRSRNRIRDARL
jgi:hypothetical protein